MRSSEGRMADESREEEDENKVRTESCFQYDHCVWSSERNETENGFHLIVPLSARHTKNYELPTSPRHPSPESK